MGISPSTQRPLARVKATVVVVGGGSSNSNSSNDGDGGGLQRHMVFRPSRQLKLWHMDRHNSCP